MRIKMLQTRIGTENGFIIKRFVKGEEYEIREHLARYFLTGMRGVAWAVRVKDANGGGAGNDQAKNFIDAIEKGLIPNINIKEE